MIHFFVWYDLTHESRKRKHVIYSSVGVATIHKCVVLYMNAFSIVILMHGSMYTWMLSTVDSNDNVWYFTWMLAMYSR